jgi:NADH-quinone oxidoreductase subunit E
MMQLGDFTKNLTQEKIDQLIIDCKDGKIILQDLYMSKKDY